MMLISLISLGLIVVVYGQVVPDNSASPRIVNGVNAKLGEIPYQVSLQRSSYHFCGGSIVNASWIVTAAHCVHYQSAEEIKIVVGTIDLKKPYKSYQAEKIVVHEKYNPNAHQNDIAMIKVNKTIEFSNIAQPVALPTLHWKVKTNSTATVSGWGGLINSWSETPDALQKANIYISDQEYCQTVMKEMQMTVHPTNICAYDPSIRKGQCNGDSGGPLTVEGRLTGIVSWSIKDPDCASTKYPGVYTRVPEFVDWIQDKIKST